MTAIDLIPLLPLIVVVVGVLIIMLGIAWKRSLTIAATLTVVTFLAALASLPIAAGPAPSQVTPLLIVDSYALFFMGLLFTAGIAIAVIAGSYLARQEWRREEFYILFPLALLGTAILAASNHFASFFLGLELLSISLYGLIAYPRVRSNGIEAGVKYLVLAGTSAAFLLFGMALIYAEVGSLEFGGIAAAQPGGVLYLGGTAMLIVGIGYKLAVVPFHMWTPDVYQGAPVPVTAFIATVSKGGMVALLLRYFAVVGLQPDSPLFVVFAVIAVLSMFGGNLLALLQRNVKRILAYSSISHLGYILVAFLAAGALGYSAAIFYTVSYIVTVLAAFGVMAALSDGTRDADAIEDYRGLFWRRPWLAMTFTAALLSLAGIPLTGGFIGKFFIAIAGVGTALWWLVIALVLASTIGLFYYLRLAAAMYMQTAAADEETTRQALPVPGRALGAVLVLLVIALLVLGVYPTPLVSVLQAVLAAL